MAKKNEDHTPEKPKPSKSFYLTSVASKEIEEVLSHYEPELQIELIEHLQQMFKEVAEYFKTKDEAIYDRYAERQQGLLKKYGKLFKPFTAKRFDKYFHFNVLLSEKNYYTAEEFNQLKGNEDLTQQDINGFTASMNNVLSGKLHYLYLDRDPEFETAEPRAAKDEDDKDITETRQLLAIHYLLKAGFNAEARGSNSVSQAARLAHLLLGKKFTTLQNSNLYKKYKKLPNFESPGQLEKDLKYIRRYFEDLELTNVVELINKDLQEVSTDNKSARK